MYALTESARHDIIRDWVGQINRGIKNKVSILIWSNSGFKPQDGLSQTKDHSFNGAQI